MSLPLPVASFRTTITDNISESATTIPIDSYTDDDGNSMDAMVVAMVIEKGVTGKEETIIGTVDAAGSQLTGVTRGVSVRDGQTSVTSLKKTHKKKKPIEFTSHPFLVRLVRIINGTDDIEQLIRYDADYTPVLDRDLVTKGYADGLALGGSLTHTKTVIPGTAGETVAELDLVFFNTGDQEWYQVDADTAAEVDAVHLGISMGAGTDGGAISGGVLIFGLSEGHSGLTAGALQYASNTAGEISESAGTTELIIGRAISTTEILFDPRSFSIPTAAEKDLLAGITSSASEINQLDGATVTAAQLNEWAAIAAATDVTGAELEELTDGSETTKHFHEGSLGISSAGTHHEYLINPSDFALDDCAQNANNPYFFESSGVTWSGKQRLMNINGDTETELDYDVAKDITIEFRALPATGVTGDRFFGIGDAGTFDDVYNDTSSNRIGFALNAGTLYAVTSNTSTGTQTDISSSVTETNMNTYKIVWNPGTDAKFYVNGTLLATISTNLPSAASIAEIGFGGTASGEDFVMSPIRVRQEI